MVADTAILIARFPSRAAPRWPNLSSRCRRPRRYCLRLARYLNPRSSYVPAPAFCPRAASAAVPLWPVAWRDRTTCSIYRFNAFRSASLSRFEFTSRWRALFDPAAPRLRLRRWRCSAMVPAAAGTKRGRSIPLARCWRFGAGACWAVYILDRPARWRRAWPGNGCHGPLIAAVVFVPMGMIQASDTLFQWGLLLPGLGIAILSTALPYSLEMVVLTRMPSKTFGTLMSMELALAALSGMVFWRNANRDPNAGAGAIILASMGSTLTMRRETKTEGRHQLSGKELIDEKINHLLNL